MRAYIPLVLRLRHNLYLLLMEQSRALSETRAQPGGYGVWSPPSP